MMLEQLPAIISDPRQNLLGNRDFFRGLPVADQRLILSDRGRDWEIYYKDKIKANVDQAITLWDLDMDWEETHKVPAQEAMANVIWGSVLSCLGPNFGKLPGGMEIFSTLHGLPFDPSAPYLVGSEAGEFTINHNNGAVGVDLIPVDSNGNEIEGNIMSMNMPTFISRLGINIKPTFGDISPVKVTKNDDTILLELETPNKHIWRKRLKVRKIPEYYKEEVGKDQNGKTIFARGITEPCSFRYEVTVGRPTCEPEAAGCIQCGVVRGLGIITPQHRESVYKTWDKKIEYLAENNNPTFEETISGGSTLDGGYRTGHKVYLAELEKKITAAEKKYKKRFKVRLELEMMPPTEENMRDRVINDILHYARDLGWNIALSINMEYLGKDREKLIPGLKGKLSVDSLIIFSRRVRKLSKGLRKDKRIQISTLLNYNFKPAGMSISDYILQLWEGVDKLIRAGIYVDMIPAKIGPEEALQAYDPPDPMDYNIAYIGIRKKLENAGLKPFQGGCVSGCGRCHHIDEIRKIMASWMNIDIRQKFYPFVAKLGTDVQWAFNRNFSAN